MKNGYIILIALLSVLLSSCWAWDDEIIIDESYKIRGNELDLVLDIEAGEVDIIRGNDADRIDVYIVYEKNNGDCDIQFDERGRLEIYFDVEDWDMNIGDDDDEDHDHNNTAKVKIKLPYDVEIEMESQMKAGEVDMELGDLKIRNFEMKVWAGSTEINFDEPNNIEMETFDVNLKVGECSLRKLGNALFKEADINSGIGELNLDFSGKFVKRSNARVDLDIGETDITVPREIGTKMRVSKFLFLSDVNFPHWFSQKGNYYYSENYGDADKNLYLNISTGIGELDVRVK